MTTEKRKEMMCTSEKSLGTTRVLPFAGREIVGQVSVECLRFVDVHGDCTVHIMNFCHKRVAYIEGILYWVVVSFGLSWWG